MYPGVRNVSFSKKFEVKLTVDFYLQGSELFSSHIFSLTQFIFRNALPSN